MSADNYWRVCRHPKGGFTAVMGFMSDDERREPSERDPQFDTWPEAYAYADRDIIIEYGIRVDPECQPQEWKQPQWMTDCIDHYFATEKRGPSIGELLAWREADASCRMEREV